MNVETLDIMEISAQISTFIGFVQKFYIFHKTDEENKNIILNKKSQSTLNL